MRMNGEHSATSRPPEPLLCLERASLRLAARVMRCMDASLLSAAPGTALERGLSRRLP